MSRLRPIVDIVEDLIAELVFVETILDCTVNIPTNEVTLTVCDTHGLVNKGIILINSVEIKVKEVIGFTQIVIEGDTCPVFTELTIPAPNYYHGTVKATDSEIGQESNPRKITPLAYLYEVLREVRNRDPKKSVGRTVDLVIFFLEDDSINGDLTDDRYAKYISPMDNLAEDFVTLLENRSGLGSIEEEDYVIIPHAKFGFYDKLGHTKNLLSMSLSGTELRIKLPVEKNGCLECKQ